MAGPKQPIDLLVAKGKKHLTKEEIKARKEQEISVPFVDIQAPSYLPKQLQTEFNDIAEKLKALNIMTELDVDCLARYLLSKRNYLKITKKLNSIISKKDTSISEIDDYISIQDRLFKQCRSAASDLGLTISSRCKLIVPVDPTPPKANKFDKFMNNFDD
ncbi:MAG: phage terminase small subunit P27 family [Bacilli bacterium]